MILSTECDELEKCLEHVINESLFLIELILHKESNILPDSLINHPALGLVALGNVNGV